ARRARGTVQRHDRDGAGRQRTTGPQPAAAAGRSDTAPPRKRRRLWLSCACLPRAGRDWEKGSRTAQKPPPLIIRRRDPDRTEAPSRQKIRDGNASLGRCERNDEVAGIENHRRIVANSEESGIVNNGIAVDFKLPINEVDDPVVRDARSGVE